MPHSAGQRREKSTGRRGSKSSRPQRAVGAQDIKELLSLKSGTSEQSLRMSSRQLAVPSLHSSEHSTDLGTHRVSLVKSQLAWTRGSPQAEANPEWACSLVLLMAGTQPSLYLH